MPITNDNGRQYPLHARVDFTYLDLGAAVTASTILKALDLPTGARLTKGNLHVTTAWVGPAAATVDFGDVTDPDRYTPSPLDLKTTGIKALTPTSYDLPGQAALNADLVQTTSVATAGVGFLEVEYVIDNRANEVQPA